jgi:hypothetical protein
VGTAQQPAGARSHQPNGGRAEQQHQQAGAIGNTQDPVVSIQTVAVRVGGDKVPVDAEE